MTTQNQNKILTMDEVAKQGEALYENLFKGEYEGEHDKKFLAIDVITKEAFLGEYPENALDIARKKNPDGQFYLKRIGASATFHVTCAEGTDVDWILQPA